MSDKHLERPVNTLRPMYEKVQKQVKIKGSLEQRAEESLPPTRSVDARTSYNRNMYASLCHSAQMIITMPENRKFLRLFLLAIYASHVMNRAANCIDNHTSVSWLNWVSIRKIKPVRSRPQAVTYRLSLAFIVTDCSRPS